MQMTFLCRKGCIQYCGCLISHPIDELYIQGPIKKVCEYGLEKKVPGGFVDRKTDERDKPVYVQRPSQCAQTSTSAICVPWIITSHRR